MPKISINEAARLLGVSADTLRRWEEEGKISPERTEGGHSFCQATVLSAYCEQREWDYEVIKDLGSGLNYNKKGLLKLLTLIVSGEVRRLVITHKDRLMRS